MHIHWHHGMNVFKLRVTRTNWNRSRHQMKWKALSLLHLLRKAVTKGASAELCETDHRRSG